MNMLLDILAWIMVILVYGGLIAIGLFILYCIIAESIKAIKSETLMENLKDFGRFFFLEIFIPAIITIIILTLTALAHKRLFGL